MNGQSGTHADMFSKYFPGEPWTIVFEPSPEQSSSMIRLAGKYADNNTESDELLMMLGVIPSESVFNPTARDAWTKKVATRTSRDASHCLHGHLRSVHSRRSRNGQWRCRECERIGSAKQRELKKAKEAA